VLLCLRKWRSQTCEVDQTAAVATVAARLLAARVHQLTAVAEEPGAASAQRRRAGRGPGRGPAVTTPAAGRGDLSPRDRPPSATTAAALAASTRGRTTLTSIYCAVTVANRLFLHTAGARDVSLLLLLRLAQWNYTNDTVANVYVRRQRSALTQAQTAERMFDGMLLTADEQARISRTRYSTRIQINSHFGSCIMLEDTDAWQLSLFIGFATHQQPIEPTSSTVCL